MAHCPSWEEGKFSDVTVVAGGREFHLHRLMLSRSPYFAALLGSRWAQGAQPDGEAEGAAGAGVAWPPRVELTLDDTNMDADAFACALLYLYGQRPVLDVPQRAVRLLAAASFLGLDDLCAACAEAIVADIGEDTVVGYAHFAEAHQYGESGEIVKLACWGYLCRGAAHELRHLLPSLPLPMLQRLLRSDELWVHSEHERYLLVVEVLSARREQLALTLEEAGSDCDAAGLADAEDKELEAARELLGSSAQSHGALSFSHMTHEELLCVRDELEEEGLPTAAVSDGLWEQTALRSRIETCVAQGHDKDMLTTPPPPLSAASTSETRGAEDATDAMERLRLGASSGGSGSGTVGGVGADGSATPKRGLGRSLSRSMSSPPLRSGSTRLLCAFPPFRFAVEFQAVRALSNGMSQHSPEVFYAGSMWKISVQAFNDEDPHSRRTLGLFLHRRRPDEASSPNRSAGAVPRQSASAGATAQRAAAAASPGAAPSASGSAATPGAATTTHVPYADTRERVYARYQLICPAKKNVMVLGSLKPESKETHLPRAPKGWGWRTALLFEELDQYLFATPEGQLRVVGVVQVL